MSFEVTQTPNKPKKSLSNFCRNAPSFKSFNKDIIEISPSQFNKTLQKHRRNRFFPQKNPIDIHSYLRNSKNDYSFGPLCTRYNYNTNSPSVVDLTKETPKERRFNYYDCENEEVKETSVFSFEKTKMIPYKKRLRQIKNVFRGKNGVTQISARVPLFDPITLKRLEKPARGKNCSHFATFELETFLSQLRNGDKTSLKCPFCERRLRVNDLVVDGYMLKVLKMTQEKEEKYIKIKKGGKWTIEIKMNKDYVPITID